MMYRRYQPKGQSSQPIHNGTSPQNGMAGVQQPGHPQGQQNPSQPQNTPRNMSGQATPRQSNAPHQNMPHQNVPPRDTAKPASQRPQEPYPPRNAGTAQQQRHSSNTHQGPPYQQQPQPQSRQQPRQEPWQQPRQDWQGGGKTGGGHDQDWQSPSYQPPPRQPWQGEGYAHTHSGEPQHGKGPRKRNPLLNFIPASLYNPETKKVLGFLSTEDLLLVALILLFLENEENDDPMVVYALIYVLVSDYIDIGGLFNF